MSEVNVKIEKSFWKWKLQIYKIHQQFIKNGGLIVVGVGHKCWHIEVKMKGNIKTGYNSGYGQAQSTTKERKISESSSSMSIASHRKNVCNILWDCGEKAVFFFFF